MKDYRKTISFLRYLIVLLIAALILLAVFFFAYPIEARIADETLPVNETVVAELESLQDLDVGEVVGLMSSAAESREESVRESVAESESIEQSLELSSIAEEQSLEAEAQSIAESIYAASVAEESSLAEEAALNAPLAGSHLTARSVTYECDDTDIPYLRRLFSHCVVIGNSRAKNAVDCGILSENEVKYMSGVSVEVIHDFAMNAAYLYAPKTLFVMGLNDIGYFDGSNEKFKEHYLRLINDYKSINPNSIIYISEILPCPEEARPYFYRFFMIPDFNKRIKEVCDETGSIYVSARDYADFKYINSEDHAHYGKDFYYLWCQTMATQLHLWEDDAGLGYEIPCDMPEPWIERAE